MMTRLLRLTTIFLLPLVLGCAYRKTTIPDANIVWEDNDKAPIKQPEEYWSGLYWDGADKLIFRPLSKVWLFPVTVPAKNVNALGEVPNSSWYQNRLAVRTMSPEEVAKGACPDKGIDTQGPWTVKSGKVNGKNPGFVIEDAEKKRYLLKFDNYNRRATSADVIGSRMYWAAGFSTPCNELIHFDPEIIKLTASSYKKDDLGRKTLMTRADILDAIKNAPRSPDGLVRGSASHFLPGIPLGPFTYEETRSDDPNDTIPHEDRRELRGSRLLAAWINHFDAREQNTFTTFIETDSKKKLGYVQHHIIDWGDSLGAAWTPEPVGERLGHSYYLDFAHVAEDLLSLGLIERPWDKAARYKEGPDFAYFDIALFEPPAWQAGYPNTAFNSMQDADAFWATKIISRFSDEHLQALVELAKLEPTLERYLHQVLAGRRDKIVAYYFGKLTPLDFPVVNGATVCLSDLVVRGGYGKLADAYYEGRVNGAPWRRPSSSSDEAVCFDLSSAEGSSVELDVHVRRAYQRKAAKTASFHFQKNNNALRLVGISR